MLDDLLGFEAGLETLRSERAKLKFNTGGAEVVEALPVMRIGP